MKPKEVHLFESLNSILLNDIPKKGKDLEASLVACEIGGIIFNMSILDLRAWVHVMPNPLYDKFQFGDLEPIILVLKLTN